MASRQGSQREWRNKPLRFDAPAIIAELQANEIAELGEIADGMNKRAVLRLWRGLDRNHFVARDR